MKRILRKKFLVALSILGLSLSSSAANAHGGVAFVDDLCVINIEFLQAHFTVYQPETRETEEYCEDIPDVSRSVFVMEYLHDMLVDMPVDFRIIRDVNDIGQYATWEDIEAMEDLEAATVFYEAPRIEEGGFYTSSYAFDTRGTYIGIVTAEHPDRDRVYNAVFYFQVGGADLGTFPLFVGLLILIQLGYWLSNGGYSKLKHRNALKNNVA